MGSSARLFSNPRRVTPIVPANRFSQCDNCCQYSHVAVRCTQHYPTCPFCGLHPTKAAHRCPNPVCPKGGNLRPVLACCEISPAKCPNCGEPHSARYRDCSARPVPTAPPIPPSHLLLLRKRCILLRIVAPALLHPEFSSLTSSRQLLDPAPPAFSHPRRSRRLLGLPPHPQADQ